VTLGISGLLPRNTGHFLSQSIVVSLKCGISATYSACTCHVLEAQECAAVGGLRNSRILQMSFNNAGTGGCRPHLWRAVELRAFKP